MDSALTTQALCTLAEMTWPGAVALVFLAGLALIALGALVVLVIAVWAFISGMRSSE